MRPLDIFKSKASWKLSAAVGSSYGHSHDKAAIFAMGTGSCGIYKLFGMPRTVRHLSNKVYGF